MFTALTLSLAMGAPVPVAPSTPMVTGTAPTVMELKPNADGKITVTVVRTEMQKIQVGNLPANANGARPPIAAREFAVSKVEEVELNAIKDLTITTADGRKVETDEAIKKLAGSAIVVVSGDGKAVSPAFLKVFKDDTLVLASPELVTINKAAGGRIGGGVRVLPGNIQPLPVQIAPGGIQVLPIQGGGRVQIQINGAPAVLPAPPAVPVEKVPQREEK